MSLVCSLCLLWIADYVYSHIVSRQMSHELRSQNFSKERTSQNSHKQYEVMQDATNLGSLEKSSKMCYPWSLFLAGLCCSALAQSPDNWNHTNLLDSNSNPPPSVTMCGSTCDGARPANPCSSPTQIPPLPPQCPSWNWRTTTILIRDLGLAACFEMFQQFSTS